METQQKKFISIVIAVSVVTSLLFGFLAGGLAWQLAKNNPNIFQTPAVSNGQKIVTTEQEQAVINVVKGNSPAVVSIIATKDLPIIEQQDTNPFQDFFNSPFDFFSPFQFQVPQYQQKGTQKQEVGGGTGFIISADGLILTNKHVVDIQGADYTVLTNDEQKYPAKVLAVDPVQDIAIVKIDKTGLPTVKLGDSDSIQIGQSAIAIGNALGEFRNTVSVGVISGLKRSIIASSSGGAGSEVLDNVIQTDVAINPGNSGGPLLNLSGEVLGINVAMASGAENIGFALPINLAKRDIDQVKTSGKISYPFLGIRYAIITPALKDEKKLSVDYGALITKGTNANEPAIVSGSPADKAGLKENDIVLEADGQKIDKDHALATIIQNHKVGDSVTLKVLRDGKEIDVKVVLGEK